MNNENVEFIKSIKSAELSVCKKADSFLQSSMWGEFKSRFGWTAQSFLIEWENEERPLLVLCRRLLPGFSFAYVPWGPEFPLAFQDCGKHKAIAELAKKLKPFLASNTVFIRFDPPWLLEKADDASSLFPGFKRAAANVQPPDTVILDITLSCEDLLAAMKPKWRYNISLAGKKGVRVNSDCVSNNANDIEIFYSLLKETAVRDGIAVHNFDYYKTLFELCGENSVNGKDAELRLYTAVHEGDTLAAIVVLFRSKNAVYLYGASSGKKRNLMAPYALQWKAIQDAKEAACQSYDFFGIPSDDNPNHPMAGLYRFKTGFGGQIIHRPGSRDYPYKRIIYSLFNIAEAARKKLYDRKKKRKIY